MWICLNKAFLSVVDKSTVADCLVVRARVAGHIESVFPDAKVETTPGVDYLFRADIPRKEVAAALSREVMGINYPNFKDSVTDRPLHDAYMRVWHVIANLQRIPPYFKAGKLL